MKIVSLLSRDPASHRVAKPSRAFAAILAVVSLTLGDPAQADVLKVEYSGGWVATPVTAGSYDSVAGRSDGNTTHVYGANTGGGVDLISGGSASPLGGTLGNYQDLSARVDGSGTMWGVNTSGGVDWLNWNGSWGASPLVSGNYVSVAQKPGGANDSVYAARADGGIDWVRWSGVWGSESLLSTTTKYVDLAPAQTDGFLYGVTDAGAVEYITWNGTWGTEILASSDYISVAARSTDGFLYASKASGGIDLIRWSGGWGAEPLLVSSTVFTDLATDLAGNDFIWATAAIPEPSTMGLMAFLGGGILWIRKRHLI